MNTIMSIGVRLPPDPSVAGGNHVLQTELLLTAIAAGLLVGLVYSLVSVWVRDPRVIALTGVAVMLLGQATTYSYPFGVGLLLGLAYDTFEEEWYGSAIADSARASYRLRLFLNNSILGLASRAVEWTLRGQTDIRRARRPANHRLD
jgi:XapX domain-containing protein